MPEKSADQLMGRIVESVRGTFDIFTIFLGDQLGYYRELAGAGPLTSQELAARTSTHERYAREWLEQQTVNGLLEVDGPSLPVSQRKFSLPAEYAEVLADSSSANFMAPLAQLLVGVVGPIEPLLAAMKSGSGVAYADYNRHMKEGQALINRPTFLGDLVTTWVPAMPDVFERLQSDRPARVAEIGCGAGWAAIGLAQQFPNLTVDAFDLDPASINMANSNIADQGLSDRVRVHLRDAAESGMDGQYDLVCAFECIHDLSRPVDVLSAMRRLAGSDGAVLVVDERVEDAFNGVGNDVEWMMYGWSVLHCLPATMAEQPSAATGTVMRAPVLRQYAQKAGFRDVEVLPVDNYFFRLYRLWQ